MAEQQLSSPVEQPDRGGSFLFLPVGARPFMRPEKFSEEQRRFWKTGDDFLRSVNRIFEGTNEINRLLIPGMIFKRAMKGAMPLWKAMAALDAETSFPSPVGRLAPERRGAEMAKRELLFAARCAASLGPSLEKRQEVLAALADCASEVYAMDSMLGRTLAAGDRPALRDALCRFFCMESRERAYDRARTALCAVLPPEALDEQLERLARLHRYTAVNSSEVREQIVPALLEAEGCPLAY